MPLLSKLYPLLRPLLFKLDAETACDLLEGISAKINRGWFGWMDVDNSLDPIREHPRFKAFRAAVEARLSAAD